jgi:aquaporin Z
MRDALNKHWPEYLMEGAELAVLMIAMSVFSILLYHPASPVVRAIPPEFIRRILMGLVMGSTLAGIVFSPWGKQSGAHMNPAFTLTFYRLGKVAPWDAVFYVVAQFIGGIAGVGIVLLRCLLGICWRTPPLTTCLRFPVTQVWQWLSLPRHSSRSC